jgi:hypothetical protein
MGIANGMMAEVRISCKECAPEGNHGKFPTMIPTPYKIKIGPILLRNEFFLQSQITPAGINR